MDNNRVVRHYLIKECEMIRNKSVEDMKRPSIFSWLYKNPICYASISLSFFTYTVG